MDERALLEDAFGRIRHELHRICGEVTPEQLTYRPDPDANTIAWLLWHTTRQMDAQVCELAGRPQVWLSEGWAERFDLPLPEAAHGYGHTSEEVALVVGSPTDLMGYHDAVHEAVCNYIRTLSPDDLDRIVDRRWDPPVSAGVRLISTMGDGLQHVGQAAYVLGMAQRLD